MRTCSFFTLLYVGRTYERLVYTWYRNIFRMIAELIVFLAANVKKGIWWKKYQKITANRQRQNSVTVGNLIANKINTMLLLSNHQAWRQSAATSVVVSNTLDALSILRWRLCCHCCCLCAHLPRSRHLSPTASVVVSDTG